MTQSLLDPPNVVSACRGPTGSLNKAWVSSLPVCEVAHLSDEELVHAILAADFPFVDEDRLLFQDRPTLERLTHLSRRTCRNQGF